MGSHIIVLGYLLGVVWLLLFTGVLVVYGGSGFFGVQGSHTHTHMHTHTHTHTHTVIPSIYEINIE